MKFSIITINLNNAVGLKKTIESVISQTFPNFEYIVIDGDSNDGSKDIIQQYHSQITYWVSEKDSGIYNAMNKGIKVAKGEFILFLNSGDYLVNECILEDAAKLIQSDKDICTGDIFLDNGKEIQLYKNPDVVSAELMMLRTITHQSTFINTNLFRVYGEYDESFKIVSDWAFFLDMLILKNKKYQRIPIPVAVFDTSGISMNPTHLDLHLKERKQVLERLIPLKIGEHFERYQQIEYLIKGKRFEMLKLIERNLILRYLLHFIMVILSWPLKLMEKSKS